MHSGTGERMTGGDSELSGSLWAGPELKFHWLLDLHGPTSGCGPQWHLGSPGISIRSESVSSSPQMCDYFLFPATLLSWWKTFSSFGEGWGKINSILIWLGRWVPRKLVKHCLWACPCRHFWKGLAFEWDWVKDHPHPCRWSSPTHWRPGQNRKVEKGKLTLCSDWDTDTLVLGLSGQDEDLHYLPLILRPLGTQTELYHWLSLWMADYGTSQPP